MALPEAAQPAAVALVDSLRSGAGEAVQPVAERLALLRAELARRGLDGFIVPRADEHQGEYVAGRSERLAWITGFTGSAGRAVILAEAAAIFVDGRYTLQVRQQVPALFDFRHLVEDRLEDWLAGKLPAGARLGYDPWLHPIGWVEQAGRSLGPLGITLVPVESNPIDAVWSRQPPAPLGPVVAQELRYAGEDAAAKRARLGAELAARRCDAAVLTQPDAIAWLLNIRGGDVPHTPLPLSFALLRADGQVDLFIERAKLTPGLERHLGNEVAVQRPEDLGPALDALGAAGQTILVDPGSAAAWIGERLTRAGAKLRREADPCALPRARKNQAEIDGTRAAHRRDGAAMVRFLHWLDGAATSGEVTETVAATRLEAFRAEDPLFRDVSFDTIAGSGPNGAIVHYRVTPETDRHLQPGELFLLDSGAQYLDGTTDITRTVAIGTPSAEMRQRFTLVLKGHIAIATARFPKGTTGPQLDALARAPLWQAGLDYDHGTGHGVGSYLSVHEGPQRISKLPNGIALDPGMIISNEPGYYRPDAYGIRIENLVLVVPVDLPEAERPMLGFETLTFCPIDRRLVAPELLTPTELFWLDSYHARVREVLSPGLTGETLDWLVRATAPLNTES